VNTDWQTRTLGEVCEFRRGLTYAKKDEVELSGNVVLRATNIDLANCRLDLSELRYISDSVVVPEGKRVRKDSLMICTASGSKSHLGKVAYIDDDYGYAFGGFMGLLAPKSELWPKYLYYLMVSDIYRDFIGDLSDGTNINNLRFDDLSKLPVPLPQLPEQQRIVAILDKAFEGIAAAAASAEKNLLNSRTIFESNLSSVFKKKGEGWTVKKVSEVSKHSLGKMLDRAKNRGEMHPYLRNQSVRWFEFDLSDLHEMPFSPEEAEKYTAIRGDVLMCEGGYPGRAAIWDQDYPIHFQKAVHRVRFHEPEYARWFVYYLYAQDLNGDIRQHFSGTGIQHFTGQALARFEVPIPPLQQVPTLVSEFDDLFAQVHDLQSIYQRKLAALDELKKSLLHQAFSGNL
jgi:type I restriction enzyme S subunit